MVNHEKELLKTTDREMKDMLVRRLVNAGVSYLEKWEKVSFFKRKEYNGAREVCVIMVNDHQLEKAEGILEAVKSGESDPNEKKSRIKALLDRDRNNTPKEPDGDFLDDED